MNISKYKIIIITHIWGNGPAQAMRKYLTDNKISFLWITHPLFPSNRVPGFGFESYKKGERIKVGHLKNLPISPLIKFLTAPILNIVTILLTPGTQNANLIGYNNLNTFSGLFLKKLGFINKVIYYVVDYVPQRFENPALNFLYHKLDQFCVRHADETWNINEAAMNTARSKFFGFDPYKPGTSTQKNVPMGFWKERIKIPSFEKIHKRQLIFTGYLYKKQGIQYILRALPHVVKKLPDIKLIIIGEGEYFQKLKVLTQKLNLVNNVEFKGYLPLEEVEKILVTSALALAPYQKGDTQRNFTYYADPSKLKDYIGCGLPVLLTDVPTFAQTIKAHNCGIIIDNNPRNIATAIINTLGSDAILKTYRKNVLKLRKLHDWNKLLEPVMKNLL